MTSALDWATEEFGGARLGDLRRTGRLVALAAEVATRPSGTVTGACQSSAAREGAFRWLENDGVSPSEVLEEVVRASTRRCASKRSVFVAVDATSLTLTDRKCVRELGAVGAWASGARGVHAMTAFAADADGVIGVCAQAMWRRKERSTTRAWGAPTDPKKTETHFWLDVLEDTQRRFFEHAPDCTPWFQLDRGGDCWAVLQAAHDQALTLTVRAVHDRKVADCARGLHAIIEVAPVVARKKLVLASRSEPSCKRTRQPNRKRVRTWFPPRKKRTTVLSIRGATLPIVLKTTKGERTVEFGVVLAQERGRHDDRVEWLLLTTHPVRTKRDVLRVVDGYVHRWRIEELHRVWKRGLCNVERTQLQSFNAIQKWATILLAVAARAMRLSHRSKVEPGEPADVEFTRYELDALIALRQPKGVALGDTPTLGDAVRWLADLGGAMAGPKVRYGPQVIGRGLLDVLAAARAFEMKDKMR